MKSSGPLQIHPVRRKAQPFRRVGLLLSIALWIVSGCVSGLPKPSSVPAPTVTITFACRDDLRSIYESLAEAFHARQPGIEVRIVSWDEAVGESDSWSPEAVVRLVTRADAAIAPLRFGPSVTRQGLLRDLTPFIEGDPTFEPDDFWPGVLDACRWDGGTWALPSHISLWLLLYDADAFDEAGISDPRSDWSRDDFTAAAEALTRRQDDQVRRWGFADWRFMGMWGMVDTPWRAGERLHPVLDDPALVEQLRWYVELAQVRNVMPGEDISTWTQAAMRPAIVPFQDATPRPARFGLITFPDASKRGTIFTCLSYIMSAGTAHPEATWQWLAFLSRQPVATGEGNAPGIPARRSVVETSEYWETQPPEVAAASRQALRNLRPAPIWDVAQPAEQAVAAALARQAELREALETAQLQAQARSLSYDIGPTPTPLPVNDSLPVGSASSAVTIRFYADGPPHWYKDAIERFENAHPDIRVRLVQNLGHTVEPGITMTTLPDVAQGSDCFKWGAPLHESMVTFTLDLEPLLYADPDFSIADYYPGFLDLFRSAGALHGLPSEATVGVLWYNRRLFDAAGLSYPAPGLTLEQFRELAIALTEGEGKQKRYGFVPLIGTTSSFDYFISQMGAARFDLSIWPPRPLFDSPEMIRAVDWYTGLVLVDGVQPNFPLWSLSRGREYFEDLAAIEELVHTGRAAMWMGTSLYRRSYSFNAEEFSMAPLPLGSNGGYPVSFVEGYYISADTAYPYACWEWIKFLTTEGYLSGGLPARRAIFESSAYRTRIGEETALVYEYIVRYGKIQDTSGSDGYLGAADYWLYSAVDAVLEGEPVEDALAQAQLYAERYVSCLLREGIAESGEEVNKQLVETCLREVDPEHPALRPDQWP